MSVGSTAIQPITQAELDAHSEQALIELVYIQTANDVLGNALLSLQQALSVTQNVLNTLTGLQNLHNSLFVSGKGQFNFNFAQTPGSIEYVHNYTSAASAFFGTPIDPKFIYTDAGASGFAQFQSDILALKQQVTQEIPQLSAITPRLSGGGEDPNSLLAKMRVVLADLNNYNLNTFSGCQAWTIDNYNVHGSGNAAKAGIIQQHLTFAVTAGESLNDTQKESVRNYLFIFEEYYKSASAVLQAITQIISKMAGNIAR